MLTERPAALVLFTKGIGLLFCIVGMVFIFQSVGNYLEAYRQRDWPAETATLLRVDTRTESSGGIRVHSRKTVYDMYYEYTVDTQTYSGILYGKAHPYGQPGKTFLIKYNPNTPSEHTDVLSPSLSGMVSEILVTCVWILLSLFLSGNLPVKQKASCTTKQKHQRPVQ